MTRNQLEYWRLQEDKRHNRRVEKETERANRVASTDRRIAYNLDYMAKREANTINRLYNQQYITEMNRHNLVVEAETGRHNLEQERLQAQAHANQLKQIQLGYDQMSNAMNIARLQSKTAIRTATINANVGYAQVAATNAMTAENRRANIAREAETAQHNRAQENIQRAQNVVAQTNASTQARKQDLAESQWKSVGYDVAQAELTRTRAQTLQSWATTDYTKTQTKLAPVNTASSIIGNGANVIRAIKGGRTNGTNQPKIEWPDGSVSY